MTDNPIATAILDALKQGGRNRGELFDLTGQPYSRLVPALDALLTQQMIESYFHQDGDNLPILTYRLRSSHLPKQKLPSPPPPPPPLIPLLKQSRMS